MHIFIMIGSLFVKHWCLIDLQYESIFCKINRKWLHSHTVGCHCVSVSVSVYWAKEWKLKAQVVNAGIRKGNYH